MKKLTATLLLAGGLSVTAAGTAEFMTTEKGKEIIENLEDGKIKNFGNKTSDTTAEFNDRVKNIISKEDETKKTEETKKIDITGAGDPPLKIGNIIINENDILTSLTNELGIRSADATQFALDIVAIRDTPYQPQYKKVIDNIDKFVAEEKITSKQGWALMLYITNDERFRTVFDKNHEMTKLFNGALENKEVKDFYEFGNKTGTIKGEVNSDYGNIVASADDDLGLGDLDLGYAEENAETDRMLAESQAELEKVINQGREKIIKSAKKYVAIGGNPADVIENWDEIMKKYNITPDDLVD